MFVSAWGSGGGFPSDAHYENAAGSSQKPLDQSRFLSSDPLMPQSASSPSSSTLPRLKELLAVVRTLQETGCQNPWSDERRSSLLSSFHRLLCARSTALLDLSSSRTLGMIGAKSPHQRRICNPVLTEPPRPWVTLGHPRFASALPPLWRESEEPYGVAARIGSHPDSPGIAVLEPNLPQGELTAVLQLVAPAFEILLRRERARDWWEDHVNTLASSLPSPVIIREADEEEGSGLESEEGGVEVELDGRPLGLPRHLLHLPPSHPEGLRLPSPETLVRLYDLTEKEAETTLLLAKGYSTKALARAQGVSWHTARGRVERCRRKLGVSKRTRILPRIMADATVE